jgi:hypothetical protein
MRCHVSRCGNLELVRMFQKLSLFFAFAFFKHVSPLSEQPCHRIHTSNSGLSKKKMHKAMVNPIQFCLLLLLLMVNVHPSQQTCVWTSNSDADGNCAICKLLGAPQLRFWFRKLETTTTVIDICISATQTFLIDPDIISPETQHSIEMFELDMEPVVDYLERWCQGSLPESIVRQAYFLKDDDVVSEIAQVLHPSACQSHSISLHSFSIALPSFSSFPRLRILFFFFFVCWCFHFSL